MTTPHIVVVHRWRDRHALYADYVDHATHRVSYITTAMGRESVPASAADVVEVPATDDLFAVRAALADLARRGGAPTRLVALNEGDLDVAAVLRDELGLPGQGAAELERFRDKLIMVSRVAAAGVPAPAFAAAPDAAAVADFATAHGWPVVVKPRRGTASRGVLRLDGPADLARLTDLDAEPHLVQTFVGDQIFHIDGLWTGTALGPWRASRYVNSCVEFTTGAYLGSVEVDEAELLDRLAPVVAATVGALGAEPWVFHLELFVGVVAGGVPRFTFLEAGARVGGAEIPFVWREVHGTDLMRAAIDLQLGRAPAWDPPVGGETAGWLLLPVPVPAPCRVLEAGPLPDRGDGPYAWAVPAAGADIPRVGGYEHVGARFRFRGTSSQQVEAAIRKTAAEFRLRCAPIVDDRPR